MIVGKSPPSNVVLPGPPGKSVSPVNSSGVFSRAKEIEPADHVDRVVLQEMVVARQHRRVLVADPDVDAGFAYLLDGPNVVPVAVGLENRGDSEAGRHAKQAVVLVRGVDQRRHPGAAASHHVDVVFHWSHDETVHLGARVRPDQFHVVHVPRMPRPSRVRVFANVAVTGITVR
jgi:hypothetical protein